MPESTVIADLLGRGVVEAIDARHLTSQLKRGKPLRVKLGIDPTAHHLHLGHAVLLRKLHAFQRAGHQAILVIGDFTAQVGDPSGRDTTRPALSAKQVSSFAETYLEQAGKILDLRKTEVRHNSEWLAGLSPTEFLKLLGTATVQQLLAHETFARRLEDGLPLGAHEILYPLLQGYDSVAVEADIELGGLDQKFNVLAGRDLQKAYGQDQQDVILLQYLLGTDGKQKMSKSIGNTINLTDSAEDMFGKVMSIPDKLIVPYLELATAAEPQIIAETKKKLRAKTVNPRDLKAQLAQEIVGLYHSPADTAAAADGFVRVHQKKQLPSTMPTITIRPGRHMLLDVLVSQKLVNSRSEARRLVEQGGVRLDRKTLSDWQHPLDLAAGSVLEVGKRKFFRIVTGR